MVILTDANQPAKDRTQAYGLRNLIQDSDLSIAMEEIHPHHCLRSTKNGTKTIDHVLTADISSTQVLQAGRLPFNIVFSSDHRGQIIDLDSRHLLHLYIEDPSNRDGRRLSSGNRKKQTEYIDTLLQHVNAHNVI